MSESVHACFLKSFETDRVRISHERNGNPHERNGDHGHAVTPHAATAHAAVVTALHAVALFAAPLFAHKF
jgi:hypothetical protein